MIRTFLTLAEARKEMPQGGLVWIDSVPYGIKVKVRIPKSKQSKESTAKRNTKKHSDRRDASTREGEVNDPKEHSGSLLRPVCPLSENCYISLSDYYSPISEVPRP